jgi:hypothetical protein
MVPLESLILLVEMLVQTLVAVAVAVELIRQTLDMKELVVAMVDLEL